MKVIYNNIIPFPSFKAINLFGILFARTGSNIDSKTINHESIHTVQMKEMLYIFFYIWYVLEWFVRLFMKGNAYKNISFEREAYGNERNYNYLNCRKHYSWFKYLKNYDKGKSQRKIIPN